MVLPQIEIEGRIYKYHDAKDLADKAGISILTAKNAVKIDGKYQEYLDKKGEEARDTESREEFFAKILLQLIRVSLIIFKTVS